MPLRLPDKLPAIELLKHENIFVMDESILRGMTLEFHEIDLKLQRRIGQQSHEVGLCSYLQP